MLLKPSREISSFAILLSRCVSVKQTIANSLTMALSESILFLRLLIFRWKMSSTDSADGPGLVSISPDSIKMKNKKMHEKCYVRSKATNTTKPVATNCGYAFKEWKKIKNMTDKLCWTSYMPTCHIKNSNCGSILFNAVTHYLNWPIPW